MAKRLHHGKCNVPGCSNEDKSLFSLPSSQPLKTQWLNFICSRGVTSKLIPKNVNLCAKHFSEDCFHNLGQYRAGFAQNLKLKSGSIPTLDGLSANEQASSSSVFAQTSQTRDSACQTDPIRLVFTGGAATGCSGGPKAIQGSFCMRDWEDGTSSSSHADPSFLSSTAVQRPAKRPRLELEEELDGPFEGTSSELTASVSMEQDSTREPANYTPTTPESTARAEVPGSSSHRENKFIVYESCIMELFQKCPLCTRPCDVRSQRLGTFLSVNQQCSHCSHTRRWNSQPILGSTPAGNLQLSAAMYLSGASFILIEKVFKALKLPLFGYETFRRLARAFIEPAILHHWKVTQDITLQRLTQEGKVILGGDMRADSPVPSAKYGSYAMMDLRTNTIVDIQLVQSNEVGRSNCMEKEGLSRSLTFLEARGINIDSIVTGRHPQVQEFLRERNVNHYFDVRHFTKDFSKKLEAISKQRDCGKLKKWMKCLNNHVHFTASGSTSGAERAAKWTAMLNHVQDIHTHEDPLYPACEHAVRKTRDPAKWLQPETPVFEKLKMAMTKTRTLNDVAKLSPQPQTSTLEAFHSVIPRFAPKNVVFPYVGMLCRLYLAAIHFNENANRPQAQTADGVPLFKISLPKSKKGECRVKCQKIRLTFGYLDVLMDLIFDKVFVNPAPYTDAMLAIRVPEDLSAQFNKPDKEEVIASFVSRFTREAV
ncbi:uncharacterized protein LOC134454691 [Engraulis encrasicolus]|uniref:uncharacterized protein LOC134454691 n=1 Tax=Engraulis encrasicolus TaxID=184585 RepID=UPI002FD6949C